MGQKLGLKGLHPYQLHHGGAAEDLNSRERSRVLSSESEGALEHRFQRQTRRESGEDSAVAQPVGVRRCGVLSMVTQESRGSLAGDSRGREQLINSLSAGVPNMSACRCLQACGFVMPRRFHMFWKILLQAELGRCHYMLKMMSQLQPRFVSLGYCQ